MQADRLTHQIYTWSKSLADTGITNWAGHTSNLLSSLYENNLLQQDYAVGDLWVVVMEQELQAWRSSVEAIPNDSETGGHLLFYRQVKS